MSIHRFRFDVSLAILISFIALNATYAEEESTEPSTNKLPAAAERKIDFIKDIQPILAASCYSCHGTDNQEAGLRLDARKTAFEGGDSGSVILKGDSAKSPLIHLVARIDPEMVMPPEGEGDPLTAAQVGLLRAWIDQGAVWPDSVAVPKNAEPWRTHWAFQPINRPDVPPVKNSLWVRNPIDAFILENLESEGVEPSPEASRTTLIRRLSLDLLGLPPTPGEVEEFLYDERPDAYERLVERLLQSKHFGERWGRHWLDLARYADSDGYEKDRPRPWAWRYRNWVIDAINADMPFDQFTIEQLAGDLLPNPTLDQKIATGFHRNTLTNTEGGTDQEEDRIKQVVDRLNTTGSVWLGLTVGCSQCHSHKYDPLRQREYYGMFAFFNSGKQVDISAPLPEELSAYEAAKAKWDQELVPLAAAVAEFEKKHLNARREAWEKQLAKSQGPLGWTILRPVSYASTGGSSLDLQDDQSLLATGVGPTKDVYTIVLNTKLKQITGLRLELLPDSTLPKNGPGRAEDGKFVLSELTATAAPVGDPTQAIPLTFINPRANAAAAKSPITAAVDGKDDTGWSVGGNDKNTEARIAHFEIKEDVNLEREATLVITLKQLGGGKSTLGRLRLAVTGVEREQIVKLIPDPILDLLTIAADRRSPEQQQKIEDYYKTVDEDYLKLTAAVNSHNKQKPQFPPTMAQTLIETEKERKNYLLIRGDFLRRGEEVEHHTPEFLHSLKSVDTTPTRMDLARWIMAPDNPLTARVTVNRIWKNLLGSAIVATEDDFGMRGDQPTHPKLLDWLASEMIAQGWSRKQMIRTIVNSATYRQSSAYRDELAARDPENDWLARQNRFRLEAEVIRDSFLASSGLLSRKIGGPSVKPPLPADVAALGYAGSIKWKESAGESRYRRGLYIFFQRTVPYPMLVTFDAPDSNVTCVRRERSNTPLQSLTLLNDPVFFETAQALGRRVMAEFPRDKSARLQRAFQLCMSRRPTSKEFQQIETLYDEMAALAANDTEAAARLIGYEKTEPEKVPDTAAAVAVARIILNLDEFVTRE